MVRIDKDKDAKIIEIDGPMTIFNANEIVSFIDLSDCKEVKIDLSNVTEFDTAGFQILLAIKKEAINNNISLKFANISENVNNLLEIYRTKDYLLGVSNGS